MTQPIRVEGLRELQRAFKAADKTLQKDLRSGLRAAAEPVRASAESLAALEDRTNDDLSEASSPMMRTTRSRAIYPRSHDEPTASSSLSN